MLSSRAICILAGSLVNIRRPVSKNGGLHWIKRSWNWVTMWPVNSVNRPVEISNPVDWDTCCIFHAHPAPCPGWLCDVWQLVIGVRLLRLLCSGVREQKWSDLFRCDTIGNTRQELCPASIWTCGCTAWQLTRANDKISPQWISRRILWEGQPRPQYYLNIELYILLQNIKYLPRKPHHSIQGPKYYDLPKCSQRHMSEYNWETHTDTILEAIFCGWLVAFCYHLGGFHVWKTILLKLSLFSVSTVEFIF